MGVTEEDLNSEMKSPITFDTEKSFHTLVGELNYQYPLSRDDCYKLLEQVKGFSNSACTGSFPLSFFLYYTQKMEIAWFRFSAVLFLRLFSCMV